ncbi:AAA family ATPase [Mucilaginibacter sp. 14171R-50]|uniref:AAA family ATPase n=1 Tax=Mucilaginibacter sp. 14171R-50 TaxID=2703789 RepID=UPI00138D123E|nr:AAA family ATPase [Mucilaginibacter sp. 14171R-50]QHS56547.1 AAA family ATPase [Mucilaginibacter sp. 14171R-50]
MIAKIDVSQFGLFKNYAWDTAITNESFKKINIIYGRNYSGKTTLSRIFKCIEDTLMHKDYFTCQFKVTLSGGQVVTNSNLQDFAQHHKIRVYNTDFVRENLGWLHREDGTIKPFTILGAANVELEKQIEEIVTKLGAVESNKGLIYELAEEETSLANLRKQNNNKGNEIEDKLKKRAADHIKITDTLFVASSAKKTYTITDIKAEIITIGDNPDTHFLDAEQTEILFKLLKEAAMDDIDPLPSNKPKFAEYAQDCETILQQKITPSKPITELINDSLLQEWVRQGIDKHRGKRATCGFCGNDLGSDLWDKLDQHFSKESEELRNKIRSKIDELEIAKKGLNNFLTLKRDLFYGTLQGDFDIAFKQWSAASSVYMENIERLITELKAREKDIFKERSLPELTDASESLIKAIKAFNDALTDHNRKTSTLAKDQDIARKKLRLAHIAQFITDIDYKNVMAAVEAEDSKLNLMGGAVKGKREAITRLQDEKRNLEAQAKDESKGAELVNQHLMHYFGHSELKLVAEGEQPNVKFIIHRDGAPANNLSEGECSLISFCYFMAKIEDELKDETESDKLVIYIDDPISSLDSNHIFFMFSLIENVIAKPKKYGQLFISTHNMEFLKYVKKLTGMKTSKNVGHFMIERRSQSNSILMLAPPYMKNYITEFNYLFDQIYQCSIGDREFINNNYQYSFGNNMRKFLESYTFYRYPTHNMSFEQRLLKYFQNDGVTYTLISRVINEYSHMEDQFDRGMQPIDMDEITRVSSAVIEKIRTADPDQFEALMDSVNQVA